MAGRTVDQGVSMLTAGEIRVAVLPVGPVPRDVLDDYLELIGRYHHVSLSATRSFYRESTLSQQAAGGAAGGAGKTPFQFMDWSNSYMHLRFLQSEDARRRTRLADLHPGRQVLAILGVVYCPMCASVQQAYDEFKKICRMYPEAFVARCFVFEPSEDHIRQERECQQLADLVMFPPGGPGHLEQHLEVWMHDLAAALLTEFENWMLAATPALMKLNGYADSAEFTGASPVLDEMQKRLASVDGEMREKQRWGRLMKMKGDMCLLSGSPRDAAEHYRTGQEIAKACSDWVWYAAALEGIATARLHEVISGCGGAGVGGGEAGGGGGGGGGPSLSGGRNKANSARGKDGGRAGGTSFMTAAKWDLVRRSDTESLVRECFADARAAYKKKGGVAALTIEQHLKLARLVAGLRGGGARREVGELVAAVSDLLPFLPAAEDRIVAIVECAQIVGMVGCRRKRTLLLWHSMEQSRLAGSEKGDLLRIAVRALEPPEDPQTQDVDDGPRTHWSVSRAISRSSARLSCGWEAVHTVVLEAALAAAKQAHAPAEAWEVAATLLRDHHSVLSPQHQAALLETLSQASAALPTRHRTRPGLGPAPLVQLKRVLPAALPLQPTPLTLTAAGTIAAAGGAAGRGKSGASGPFIFNPYAAKRQAKQEAGEANSTPDWACSDEGRVEVYLVNPLSVPLKIDQLQLHVKFLGPPGTPTSATASSAAAPGGAAAGGTGGSLVRGSSGRQPHASSAAASGTATPAHGGSAAAAAAAAAAASKAFKTPALNMLLLPNGRPHRAILCGKPQLPGTYSIEGCLVTSWGVTWQVPFTVPQKRIATSGRSGSASAPSGHGVPAGGRGGGGGGSGGGAHSAASSACRTVNVNVLPQLPLVKAVIRASPCTASAASPQPGLSPQPSMLSSAGGSVSGAPPALQQQPAAAAAASHAQHAQQHAAPSFQDPTVVAISPRDDDIHASSAQTAFSEDLQRSPPVAVFEGQRLSWSLALHNLGALPVTALSVMVTNHKGVALKPLRGSPLPASFQGVHLEVDDAALQPPPPPAATATATATAVSGPASPVTAGAAGNPPAAGAGPGGSGVGGGGGGGVPCGGGGGGGGGALPLRPGGVVTLPLVLAVGQAPRGTFREVALEVTVSYLTKPSDRPEASDESTQVLGRRMTINLTFDIQPSLAIASTFFLDHFAPLLNGRRVAADRPIDLRLTAGGASSVAAAVHGGGGGGGDTGADDDSDSGNDGGTSRSTSLATDLSLGHYTRSRVGSLITVSQNGAVYGPGGTAGSFSLQHMSSLASSSALGGLSARLAGLDLSLGTRSSRAGAGMPFSAMHSAFTLPTSPSGGSAPPWLVLDPRDSGMGSFTTRGSSASAGDPSAPSLVGVGVGVGVDVPLAVTRSALLGRSAVVRPEGPNDTLGSATDSVLCVTVRNTSNYYFRAWLAHLDDPNGSPPLTAAAATSAGCPIEVLQPGDTARLACVLPSAAMTYVARLQEDSAASAAAAAAAAAAHAATPDDAGAEDEDGTGAQQRAASAAAAAACEASLRLRRVKLTVQPPGGGAGADAHSTATGPDAAAGCAGGGGGEATAGGTRFSIAGAATAAGSVGSAGGAAAAGELAEEGDRMAAAEALAEGWAVVWELVTGLSEAAAGRAPPRGMVRLAAVDIARSLSTTAVHALWPSTIHFQFQALPPSPGTAGSAPRLKDLTYRLQALGLLPPHVAGSVWGLRAQLGEVFRCELLLHNGGTHPHHLTFSLAAVNSATCAAPSDPYFHSHGNSHHHYHQHHGQGQGQGQSMGQQPGSGFSTGQPYGQGAPHGLGPGQGPHLHAASFQTVAHAVPAVLYGAPFLRQPHPQHRIPHTLDGYASGGSLALGGGGGAAMMSYNRGAGGVSGADLRGGSGGGGYLGAAAAAELGIDPGVVIVGAVQNVHITVEPRSTARHPFALTFAHPGLYQLSVCDVCVVPEGPDAGLWAGRPDQVPPPQRIYASVDRLNILCV